MMTGVLIKECWQTLPNPNIPFPSYPNPNNKLLITKNDYSLPHAIS